MKIWLHWLTALVQFFSFFFVKWRTARVKWLIHSEWLVTSLVLLPAYPRCRGITAIKQVCCWLVVMVTALALDAGDAVALMCRAEVRALLGRRDDAIDDYRRAVHLQTRPVCRQHPTAHTRYHWIFTSSITSTSNNPARVSRASFQRNFRNCGRYFYKLQWLTSLQSLIYVILHHCYCVSLVASTQLTSLFIETILNLNYLLFMELLLYDFH